MTATSSPTEEEQSESTPALNLFDEEESESTPLPNIISPYSPTPTPTPTPTQTQTPEEQSISVSTPTSEEQSVSVSTPTQVEEEQVETSFTQSQKKAEIQAVVESFQRAIVNINLAYKSDIANGVRQVDAIKIYNSNILIILNSSITPLIKEGLIRNIPQFLVRLETINGKINIGLYNIIAQKYNIFRLSNLK